MDADLSNAVLAKFLRCYLQADQSSLKRMDSDRLYALTMLAQWNDEARYKPELSAQAANWGDNSAHTSHTDVGVMQNLIVSLVPPLNWTPSAAETAWANMDTRHREVLPIHFKAMMADEAEEDVYEHMISPYNGPSCAQFIPEASSGTPGDETMLQALHEEQGYEGPRFSIVRNTDLIGCKWSLKFLDEEGNFTDQEYKADTHVQGRIGLDVALGDTLRVYITELSDGPNAVPMGPPEKRDYKLSPEILGSMKHSILSTFMEMTQKEKLSLLMDSVQGLSSENHDLLYLAPLHEVVHDQAVGFASMFDRSTYPEPERLQERVSESYHPSFHCLDASSAPTIHKIRVSVDRHADTAETE
jgi:hypothetical protein